MQVERGERLVVLGPNGAGKSTLLRALAGNPSVLREDEWRAGEGLLLGVFEQDQAQFLPDDKDPLTYVPEAVAAEGRQRYPDTHEVRKALGALGLRGEDQKRRIGEFSGGEKARVSLAVLSMRQSNCLLLDEASNHLDIGAFRSSVEPFGQGRAVVVV